ncbi:MAG: NADP-dependent malic enzyme [Deltaproteobacteria bacterium]|nr:NADP-dependent malic enzyme [Deltaproteobacteria bacterium]
MKRRLSKEELIAKANRPSEDALRLHPLYKGKMQTMPKCAVRGFEDFAVWYTPGVAASCRAIVADPALVFEHTNKANSIAIVTDGTRILGLGDIGPEAGLPVMEGKALLFKYLGGVDAVPICLASKNAAEIIRTVQLLQPAFGGINLEDIAQPKCFHVLDELRSTMTIPVWHDDQQGTATVVLAALTNALKLVGKRIDKVKIAFVGMGAANVATYRLLKSSGMDPQAVVACNGGGILHRGRSDVEKRQADYADLWRVCNETNPEQKVGGIAESLRGCDVCIAFSASGPDIIKAEWIRAMAKDAIVFACANPVPEIWPWDANDAGARIVATGRSDFPNQLNNSLVFPGIFRGALDVRARTISDGMAKAAARELAACAEEAGLDEERILPRMDEWDVVPRQAVATALAAQQEGVAQLCKSREQLHREATAAIKQAREATRVLMKEGLIAPAG